MTPKQAKRETKRALEVGSLSREFSQKAERPSSTARPIYDIEMDIYEAQKRVAALQKELREAKIADTGTIFREGMLVTLKNGYMNAGIVYKICQIDPLPSTNEVSLWGYKERRDGEFGGQKCWIGPSNRVDLVSKD